MEGVQAPLARIAAKTYIAQAAVNHANMIDQGEKPAVPSAILKYHLTEFQREILTDITWMCGGKTVTLDPATTWALVTVVRQCRSPLKAPIS